MADRRLQVADRRRGGEKIIVRQRRIRLSVIKIGGGKMINAKFTMEFSITEN
jgi:hypothetical protein